VGAADVSHPTEVENPPPSLGGFRGFLPPPEVARRFYTFVDEWRDPNHLSRVDVPDRR